MPHIRGHRNGGAGGPNRNQRMNRGGITTTNHQHVHNFGPDAQEQGTINWGGNKNSSHKQIADASLTGHQSHTHNINRQGESWRFTPAGSTQTGGMYNLTTPDPNVPKLPPHFHKYGYNNETAEDMTNDAIYTNQGVETPSIRRGVGGVRGRNTRGRRRSRRLMNTRRGGRGRR